MDFWDDAQFNDLERLGGELTHPCGPQKPRQQFITKSKVSELLRVDWDVWDYPNAREMQLS